VRLAADGITRALTSTGGVFSFADLHPGTYKLTFDVPDRFTGPDTAEFTIPDTHACIDRSFLVKGRVGNELSTR
jgi:hypothetical protein